MRLLGEYAKKVESPERAEKEEPFKILRGKVEELRQEYLRKSRKWEVFRRQI